ncbi:3-keto-5-aminohexanoate cleavage enzyme [Proteiniborus ethanoligenes]|uniref:3-keto-5-aminohexanoate cleavage enzyme n=1 Tax=Proteiniborus ethanoligenes TaxID=415015 RepID=A0A1H3LSY4_9FIRM|nr:3-keto-5-aminohexanoate cleavage protein [Proteiniborus ethanoligenes]SDY67473.1 3-keto-5-aminohexanoate cleavage enzyme [Proteiniborus ethanoligenes]
MEKVIISAALTGVSTFREQTPYVPITPEEIADQAYESWKAGASIVHIHVREEDGTPSMNFEKFEKTVKLIRERCDVVINLTTSGGIGLTDEVRIRPFYELKPEIASYDAGTMNWQHRTVFENRPEFLEKLAKRMKEVNVKPEVEIFDTGMIYNTMYYASKGLIDDPIYFQFVLGAPGGMTATVKNLLHLKESIPEGSIWSAFGIGKGHLPIMYATLALGGNIRVGLEDNIYYSKGVLAKSNAELVERAVRVVKEFGKQPATPDEAREILKLRK